ncbi:hypothetical protein MNBD_GAMMA12-445 [hydrothermal vent metagenome]|uniref:Tetratricopeptide repeat protein n=1 Tax=hydrothermal vent metagenome TaxID=652676 RepID=A0A3B0YRA7_9ZZZZ
MSLLLDALKNAENVENIDNKSDMDKNKATQENLVADGSNETFDRETISNVDIEEPALPPRNKVDTALDKNTLREQVQETIIDKPIEDPRHESDKQNLIAAQRYGVRHAESSIDDASHTADDNQRRATDAHQTPLNTGKLHWDLPSNSPSNTSAESIKPVDVKPVDVKPENKQTNTDTNNRGNTNSTIPQAEGYINESHSSLPEEASDKPQFFHYSKPTEHSNHKTILVIIFILIGAAAGTILLFILNQLDSRASLFSRPNTVSKTIATSHNTVSQRLSKPADVDSITANPKSTKINKVLGATKNKTRPNKTFKTTTLIQQKQIADQLITLNAGAKNKQRLSSLDPKNPTSKDGHSSHKSTITNTSGTIGTQDISSHQNTPPQKNVIRIIKHKISVSNKSHLMDAYRYYQQRRYNKASLLYKKVLSDNNKSRDALLGLAAIAIHKKEFSQAVTYYKSLLRFDPKDRLALGGLISLKQHQNPATTVSFINQLIKQRPSAYLFFLLGNIYSSNNSWPEAQSAYFTAWNGDNTKPDYAFNLAISLDSLKQHSSALYYYQIALKLSNTNTAGFDRRLLIQRIEDLSKKNQSGSKQ